MRLPSIASCSAAASSTHCTANFNGAIHVSQQPKSASAQRRNHPRHQPAGSHPTRGRVGHLHRSRFPLGRHRAHAPRHRSARLDLGAGADARRRPHGARRVERPRANQKGVRRGRSSRDGTPSRYGCRSGRRGRGRPLRTRRPARPLAHVDPNRGRGLERGHQNRQRGDARRPPARKPAGLRQLGRNQARARH